MSVDIVNKVYPPLPVQATKIAPLEIWDLIYGYLLNIASTDLKSLVSFSLTCRDFNAIKESLKHAGHFSKAARIPLMRYALLNMQPAAESNQEPAVVLDMNELKLCKMNCVSQPLLKTSRLLATDSNENLYFSINDWECSHIPNRSGTPHFFSPFILMIVNLASQEKPLIWLDLREQVEFGYPFEDSTELEIQNCFPIRDGFILVTRHYISIWHFDEKRQPALRYCCTHPFLNCSSVVFENYFVIHGSQSQDGLLVLDLKKEQPAFISLDDILFREQLKLGEGFYVSNLYNVKGQLIVELSEGDHFTGWKKSSVVKYQKFILTERNGFELIDIPYEISICRPFQFDSQVMENWLIEKTRDLLTIINLESFETWIKIPNYANSHFSFLNNEFLFISFPNQEMPIRLIHLPTKQDYSESANELLTDYLSNRTAIVTMTIEQGNILRVLLHKNNRFELVNIPFTLKKDRDVEGKQLEIVDEEILTPAKHKQSNRTKQRSPSTCKRKIPTSSLKLHLHTKESICNQSSQRINKITIVVGMAFFFLTAAATAALILLHPGLVVYQGSGVILTMPAVLVMSLGGTASVIVIAIGSYRWWKENLQN